MERRRRSILLLVTLVPQTTIDTPAAAQQDLFERRAEVAVETGVDDRVEKTVGKAEPQEQTGEPDGDRFAEVVLLAERPD